MMIMMILNYSIKTAIMLFVAKMNSDAAEKADKTGLLVVKLISQLHHNNEIYGTDNSMD